MMTVYKKIILGVLSALCLSGTVPMGASQASASEPKPKESYNMEEMLKPVWEGETAYYESVLPVANEYGGIDPITLLYPIEEILSVQNAEQTVTYQAGVDYAVSGGQLIIADDGKIPVLSYEEFHPTTGQAGFESTEGGYVCFHEGTWFHSKQIVVTYKHKARKVHIPDGKADLLPTITQKLSNKNDLELLVFGDSISVGANSSGFTGISPYLPTYAELFAIKLQREYGVKVNLTNPSVGGMGFDWGLEQIDGVLAKQTALDLAVVAFGINDGRTSPTVIAEKANRLISAILDKFPQAEILLVAGMLPNPQAKNFYLNMVNFAEAMLENCERKGVAVVNMTAMHESLLQRKRYADMTGNNVNHPNDYLARVYAQVLFATLQKKAASDTSIEGDSTSDEQSAQPTGSIFTTLLSGCTATTSVSSCAVAALGGAVILNKKKED